MNKQTAFPLQRPISAAALLLGLWVLPALVARGQPPVAIPGGQAMPVVMPGQAAAAETGPVNPYYHVTGNDDHLKLVVNSSRFLTLDKRIPQVQVNNPDILDVTPISPNQVQISAKRTGVTQVNLWGEDKRIYTVNVIVMGDAEELTHLLRELFPRATLSVVPINGNSVMISGYVEQQDSVPKIVAVAAKYFPDVINNMTVSGAQQGIVHVKVYEISRTKMRNMGFDWASFSSNGTTVWSGVNGLLQSAAVTNPVTGQSNPTMPNQAFRFNTGGLNAFYAVLSAMRQDGLSKLDSEPDLVAISGRPAYVKVGGTLYYQTTSALGVGSPYPIDYGTRLDIVPIMLGNGRIHVDVRAKVDDLDAANSTPTNPAIKGDELETGVELRAGQTLAIAGLIENRVEATNSGLPWISEIPYLGVPFRSVSHQTNEVELLVLLTPEIVDGMEPGQVPTCLPGMNTTNPSDWELFFKGHMEVPNSCPADGAACQANGPGNIPTPACEPVGRQNPQDRNQLAANSQPPEPGFIGPIGYDVLK